MKGRRVSVAMVVAATLVTVTTLVLGTFGAVSYVIDRNQEHARLRRELAVQTDELAVGLALPVWNIDRAQIDRIIEGMEATPFIEGVIVTAAGRTHARVRNAEGKLVPSNGTFPTEGLLVEERVISFEGERIGTVRLFATSRFIDADLRNSFISIVFTILAIDLLLILSVYLVLWRAVLRPLMDIERYAVAVSAGGEQGSPTLGPAFSAELESLRSSIQTMVRLLDVRYAELQEEVGRRVASETRFRTIFDSVNEAIFIHDKDTGEILDVNATMCAMFGYTRQQVLQLALGSLSSGVPPYTRDHGLERIRRTTQEEPQLFEWHSRRKNGDLFWTEINTRAATIDGIDRVIVVVRDITQRKKVEDALKAETEFTETAINAMMGLFYVLDSQGRYVRWNKAQEELLGGEHDLLGRPGLDIVHPDDREFIAGKIAEVFAQGYAEAEGRTLLPSGEIRYFFLNGRRMDVDGQAFLVGTGIDVTERHKAEAEQQRLQKAIAQSATEWRQTFDSVRTPIIITDGQGLVRRLNDSAIELAGVSKIVGTEISTVGDGPWQAARELIRSFESGGSGPPVSEIQDSTGRTWYVNVNRLYADSSDGALIVVFWEITGIVELQQSLRRSETMSAMGALVAGVAHEVRNPLFGMSAILDAYAEEMSRPDLAEFSDGLRQQVTRLTHLMRELLEFGKPVTVTTSPGILHDLIDEVVKSRSRASREARVSLRSTVNETLPAISMDHGRLRQVFENLVDNAIQHSPAGKSVTVAANEIHHAGHTWVECRVEDDGPGFRPDDLSHVFEPFFTRRERGIGLGLSIVQRIVEEHSGRVAAANRPEGGAVITVRLPAMSW